MSSNSLRLQEKAQMFALFPKLPVELRLQIWRNAQPQRIVPIEAGYESVDDDNVSFFTDVPPLALFSVSREARGETLRSYTAVYQQHATGPVPQFFFNPNNDTIYLDHPRYSWYHVISAINASIPKTKQRVKNIAIRDGGVIPDVATSTSTFFRGLGNEVTCSIEKVFLVSTFIGGGHWKFCHTGDESDFDKSDIVGQVVKGLHAARAYFVKERVPVVRSVPMSVKDESLKVEDLIGL